MQWKNGEVKPAFVTFSTYYDGGNIKKNQSLRMHTFLYVESKSIIRHKNIYQREGDVIICNLQTPLRVLFPEKGDGNM